MSYICGSCFSLGVLGEKFSKVIIVEDNPNAFWDEFSLRKYYFSLMNTITTFKQMISGTKFLIAAII